MYLQHGLTDADGRRHPMVGLLPGDSTLHGQRLKLGYREVRALRRSVLFDVGETVRGHEFHWSTGEPPPPGLAAYEVLSSHGRIEGFADANVLGSYVHLHLASHPQVARRFVEACARTVGAGPTGGAL
jgi:cobyrinic acid a,c-diamide synthase